MLTELALATEPPLIAFGLIMYSANRIVEGVRDSDVTINVLA